MFQMVIIWVACVYLTSLPDISNWDISNVKDISKIFDECKSLISLPDISKWNTSNIVNMSYMFHNCWSLKNIPGIEKWDISNVSDMSLMFIRVLFTPKNPKKFYQWFQMIKFFIIIIQMI